jgi:hypothetical protein
MKAQVRVIPANPTPVQAARIPKSHTHKRSHVWDLGLAERIGTAHRENR